MKRLVALALLVGSCVPAYAQSSASFRISDAALNAGGHPAQGGTMISASYQVSLDAIGDMVSGGSSSSASYRSGSGFAKRYRPPGEINNLRFNVKINLLWDYDPSAGKSNLYRGDLSMIAGGAGACYQPGLLGNSYLEPVSPGPGSGWLYLATAENLLGEEGTLGTSSNGTARSSSSVCP